MARILPITGLSLLAFVHVTMSISVQEFFPDLKNNLTKITWAHATNSKEKLTAALASSDVMMIEADVVMGTYKAPNGTTIITPIMAHPPQNESDLSLEQFLTLVFEQQNKTKGVKLDFKTIEAFENSTQILNAYRKPTVPMWLNADILKGPVNASFEPVPVNPARFLKGATDLLDMVLSIGWTTRLEETSQNATSGKYTSEQVKEMLKYVKDYVKQNQSITYPVRACYAANDIEVMKSLLTDTPAVNKATLTIWSSENDKVDPDKLSQLVNSIGLDKVFVDVPKDLLQKLHFNSAFTAKSSISVVLASMIVALLTSKLL